MKRSLLPSLLVGVLAFMTTTTTATTVAEYAAQANARARASAQNTPDDVLATGDELFGEMQSLHSALTGLTSLIQTADIAPEDQIMSDAAKVVRRIRSLVQATTSDVGANEIMARRESREDERRRKRKALRGVVEPAEEKQHGIGSGEQAQPEINDYMTRKLYDAMTFFPECKEKFLSECLEILAQQMVLLQQEFEIIIHHKRNSDQDGYNKVVIVTDLTGGYVKGKLSDGVVQYPFLWDDAVVGYARQLGVQGQWDCQGLSPEDCCAQVKNSCPNIDTKGNYLECHIFVPFGGVGNKKRDDRIFVAVSPDGRVQESPFIS
mmetsp:Transcript_27064/g.56366  ORF Transcript_27064/g.56366 Transcript_27064/m.56366 type:complete len:321 (-) Transcript_27064:156-1118(-)